MINLNRKFSYTLRGKTYRPSAVELRMAYDRNVDSTYWAKKSLKYSNYKKNLKEEHYFGQNMRCAYCRTKLRANAYWEDLEHIVAQTINGNWIFYPKNLIVTCQPCNRLKNAGNTLTNILATRFPLNSNGFKIFNPHFDNWQDHFTIENGLFLRGKPGTKGPETYNYCNLHRMDVIIDYSDEQRIFSVFTMRRLTHRLKYVQKGSNEERSVQEAIVHMINKKKKRV